MIKSKGYENYSLDYQRENALILNQILSTLLKRNVWRSVRRICMWILGLNDLLVLNMLATWSSFPLPSLFICSLLLSLTCSVTVGVIEKLGIGVVPYVVLLVVPVLGRMSDQCEDVRLMATYSFATLIRLMPLEVMIYVRPFSPQDFPCCSYLQLD